MYKDQLKHWAFDRWLGLKNVPALVSHLKTKSKKEKLKGISRIEIDND